MHYSDSKRAYVVESYVIHFAPYIVRLSILFISEPPHEHCKTRAAHAHVGKFHMVNQSFFEKTTRAIPPGAMALSSSTAAGLLLSTSLWA